MFFRRLSYSLSVSALALLALPQIAQACSGCGCTLSTDEGSLGQGNDPGFRVDGRFDYIDQRDQRQGNKSSDVGIPQANGNEAEHETNNRLYTLGLDYAPNQDWGVNLAIPLLDRKHETYQPDMNGNYQLMTSNWAELSDIRVMGRYEGLTDSKNFGVTFGLKLPTGSTKTDFGGGNGPLDRSLQPGTGTIDGVIGFTQRGQFTDQFGWFATQTFQRAFDEHVDYHPGSTFNANAGLRYVVNETFTPQFQINAQNKWRDSGANADTIDSGGELVYLSPGLSVNLTSDTSAYGFVQVPVYNRVGGIQLAPAYTASIGISHKF